MSYHFTNNDLLVLPQDNHIEASDEAPKKTKLFFVQAANTWDAEFYSKVNDDVYVNIGKNHPLMGFR